MRRQWRSLTALALACVGIVLFDAWLATCGFYGCPTRGEIRAFQPSEGGKILDRDDRFLGRLAIVRRVNVPIDAIPQHVRQAFLATEDRRFYDHNGLDWRGLFRAAARERRATRRSRGVQHDHHAGGAQHLPREDAYGGERCAGS